MNEYGTTEEDFALVSVKNSKNGLLNPNARFQKEISVEEALNSKMNESPLRLLNCCPLANGATAFILVIKSKLKNRKKSLAVASSVLTSSVYGEEVY